MSLRIRAVSGMKWTGTASVLRAAFLFVRTAVLARLLTSEDFGLMAMIVVVLGFAIAFVDMGIGKAIIHKQEVSSNQLSSLYWLSLFSGVVVFVLVQAITPLIVSFYGEPDLEGPLRLAAFIFLIVPLGQQYQVLLQKSFRFDRLAYPDVISAAINATVAIIAAIAGQGVYSLVWGQLVGSVTRAFLLVLMGWSSWRPNLHFRISDLTGFIGFGLYQMGDRTVNYLSANIDYIVIGRVLGAEPLGYYQLAYELVIRPMRIINPIFNRVAFPLFALRQNDHHTLRKGFLDLTRALGLILAPICVGLVVTAPLLVPVVYGDAWSAAIPLVQILAIVGFLKAMTNPTGSILLAKGRADIGFKWNLLIAALNTIAFTVAATRFGLYAVAWTYAGVSILYTAGMAFIIKRQIQLTVLKYIGALLESLFLGIVMGASVYMVYGLFTDIVIRDLFLLIGLIMFGVVSYSLLCLVFRRKYIFDLWLLLRRQPETV